MILELSFFENLGIELLPAIVVFVIGLFRGLYKNLSQNGHPVLSMMLKWNIRLLLPWWVCVLLLANFIDAHRISGYELDKGWEGAGFKVEKEDIRGRGNLYIITYGGEDNVVAIMDARNYDKVEGKYRTNPDRLYLFISDWQDRFGAEFVYDKHGNIRHDLIAFTMREPLLSSFIFIIVMMVIFNIFLYRFGHRRYYPPLKYKVKN